MMENTTLRSPTVLARARRWMTLGLVVSIIGTRIIEGGSDGTVAAGVLPVVWIAVFATFGQVLAFASPLLSRLFSRYNPASVLVLSDLAEAVLSIAAVAALLIIPDQTTGVLVAYLLLAALFPAVTDIVEEFYAQQLAQLDEKQALSFNTAIYSVLGFVGLVMGMPAGAWLSGQSVIGLIAANAILSLGGTAFRFVSAKTVVTPPVLEQDLEDMSPLGERMSPRQFVVDLVKTGPASPGVAFLTQFGATVGGIFVYLWLAANMPWEPSTALALIIACFGVGATIGPFAAPLLRRYWSVRGSLIITYSATVVLLVVAAVAVPLLEAGGHWGLGLIYVALIGVMSRSRSVLTTTLRQQSYRGSRFSRIMGWAFALVALAEIAGSWLAVAVSAPERPAVALLLYALCIAIAGVTVVRYRGVGDSSSE